MQLQAPSLQQGLEVRRAVLQQARLVQVVGLEALQLALVLVLAPMLVSVLVAQERLQEEAAAVVM
jgi:hypothetical protein